ncbi:MAG: toxin TcdB middle/N-terminal domain-containing protein [Myxococcota bacterium]
MIRLSGGGAADAIGSTYQTEGPDKEADVRLFGDFNGDGIIDLVTHEGRGTDHPDEMKWYLRFGVPGGGFASTRRSMTLGEPGEGWAEGTDWRGTIEVVDIDGDGRSELLHPFVSDSHFYGVVEWDEGDFVYSRLNVGIDPDDTGPEAIKDAIVDRGSPNFVDINGDGLVDYVGTHMVADTAVRSLVGRLNTGRGFGPWQVLSADPYVLPNSAAGRPPIVARAPQRRPIAIDNTVRFLELNGDGRADFVVRLRTGETELFLSSANGFQRLPSPVIIDHMVEGYSFRPNDSTDQDPLPLGWTHRTLDIDGDGDTDWLYFDESMDSFVVQRNLSNSTRERLVRSTSGYGEVDGVEYGPLTDTSLYAAATDCEYPTRCRAPNGAEVVRELSLSGKRTFRYRYYAGRYDVNGRGNLGFESVEQFEVETGIMTVHGYDHERVGTVYPFLGRPVYWSRFLDQSYSETVFSDYEYVGGLPGGSYRVHQTREYSRVDEGGSARDRDRLFTDFDPFGHAGRIADSFGGTDVDEGPLPGGSTVVRRSYDTNTNDWLIHRLKREETTSAAVDEGSQTIVRSVLFSGPDAFEITEAAETPAAAVTRLIRDSSTGNLQKVHRFPASDPADLREDSFSYDNEHVFPVRHVNALGQSTRVATHPAFGLRVAERNAEDVGSNMVYDGFGNLLEQRRADGRVTTYTYANATEGGGAVGIRVEQSDNAGNRAITHLDSRGRTTQETELLDGNWYDVLTTYDAHDRVTGRTFPLEESLADASLSNFDWEVLTTYDPLGRPIAIERGREFETQLAYTATSVAETDWGVEELAGSGTVRRRIRTRTRRYGSRGNVYESTTEHPVDGHLRSTMRFHHGPFNLLTRVIDPAGAVEEYSYDEHLRRDRVWSSETGTTRFTYNTFNELVSTRYADGEEVTRTFDALGRVT